MNQVAKDCSAETERRVDAAASYKEVYDRERKEYMENRDWVDVAAHCPDEVPTMMAMIAKGAFGLAELFLFNIMLKKAADNHADICATRASEPSTW